MSGPPASAALILGFGGPQGLEEIRPFLESVLGGVRISRGRFEEVERRYKELGGVSPYVAHAEAFRGALERRLSELGRAMPVFTAYRHSRPFFEEGLDAVERAGAARAAVFVLSPFRSRASYGKYVERLERALEPRRRAPRVDFTSPFDEESAFLDCVADAARAAGAGRPGTLLLFSAHSIPEAEADAADYAGQFVRSSAEIARRAGAREWTAAYQSRSGRPSDPWLGPDVCEAARSAPERGCTSVTAVASGFLCENVEILYDLDADLRRVVESQGMAYARARSVLGDARFADLAARRVIEAAERR